MKNSLFVKYLIVFLISMLPLIELRGAIPYATVLGLPFWPSLVVAMIGNLIPVPFIFFLAHKVLLWGATWKRGSGFFKFFLNKGEQAGEKLLAKSSRGLYIALFLFVAIPLPGTGAWTGTLGASILQLDFKKSLIAVTAGVLTAGLIMWAATSGLLALGGLF